MSPSRSMDTLPRCCTLHLTGVRAVNKDYETLTVKHPYGWTLSSNAAIGSNLSESVRVVWEGHSPLWISGINHRYCAERTDQLLGREKQSLKIVICRLIMVARWRPSKEAAVWYHDGLHSAGRFDNWNSLGFGGSWNLHLPNVPSSTGRRGDS